MDLQQGSIMFSLGYTSSYVVFMRVLMYNFGSGFVGAGLSLQQDVFCNALVGFGCTSTGGNLMLQDLDALVV